MLCLGSNARKRVDTKQEYINATVKLIREHD